MPEQIALAVIFYFGQVFVFCKLIKRVGIVSINNVQKHSLSKCTNRRSRNHLTLCARLKREEAHVQYLL